MDRRLAKEPTVKLLTRHQQAETAPDRWAAQYAHYDPKSDKKEIERQLFAALDAPSFNADLVDCIIGNKSWTRIECDECGQQVERAVQVGQEPDYDSHTVTLCVPCVTKAAALAASK
jgi:hypothetical protein